MQYSLLDRRPENGMIDYCALHDIQLLPYGTVAGGFLSDRYLGLPANRHVICPSWRLPGAARVLTRLTILSAVPLTPCCCAELLHSLGSPLWVTPCTAVSPIFHQWLLSELLPALAV